MRIKSKFWKIAILVFILVSIIREGIINNLLYIHNAGKNVIYMDLKGSLIQSVIVIVISMLFFAYVKVKRKEDAFYNGEECDKDILYYAGLKKSNLKSFSIV